MDKESFMDQIDEWYDNDEHDKIIEAILALPDSDLDDDILGQLAVAYNNVGEFKKAIAVLESQRPRLDGYYKFHYRMGYALYYASTDEECENNEQLSINILERAKTEFARCMNLNPPEDYLDDCDMFMEWIEADLNGDEDEEENEDAEMYDEEEMNAIEEHIKEYYGEFPTVLHEIVSPDIHVDICIVPPTDERPYYTLVTMGMGAHIMNIPEELEPEEHGRAELLICLPKDWKIGESDEEWFWPIRLLKTLARLPINCDTWLGWGHSVDNRDPYCRGTALCGSMLISPEETEQGADCCILPNGDAVNFFEVIPIYREEMIYKIEHDTQTLLHKMGGVSHITDVNRPNCCKRKPDKK